MHDTCCALSVPRRASEGLPCRRRAQRSSHSLPNRRANNELLRCAGVFSMDGHVAPLDEICALARAHDALVFVDECHATGFVGVSGRGTDEFYGVQGQVDIINSTLGKALGGATGRRSLYWPWWRALAPQHCACTEQRTEVVAENNKGCPEADREQTCSGFPFAPMFF